MARHLKIEEPKFISEMTTIQLMNTLDNALSGINPIQLNQSSSGIHKFITKNFRKVIDFIRVTNSGDGYQNNPIEVSSLNYLPVFPTPKGKSISEFFHEESMLGLKERLNEISVNEEIYYERLNFELSVILEMDYPGYFLIVSDFIRWAKENGIPVGPGRGSGAGSLVAWALSITNVDPIEHDLLFERFLNPGRGTQYNIDISEYPVKDWKQTHEDELQIPYVKKLRKVCKHWLSENPEYSKFEPEIEKELERELNIKGIPFSVEIAGFCNVILLRAWSTDITSFP